MITALIIPLLLFSRPPQVEQQAESRFDQVFEELLKRYVAQIDAQKLSISAIDGMLNQLDPYSEYIVKDEKYQLDVLTKGQYEGVGIQLGRQNDSLLVITPMAGSPAEKQGVRPGDIILKIDSVWTRSLSFSEAARHVRGPRGRPVTLLIRRYGVAEPLEFTLIRSVIRLEDVTYSGMLDNGVGYVRLATFSRYTALHLEQEIRKLERAGMQTFVLEIGRAHV